jgi:hypothetical protein
MVNEDTYRNLPVNQKQAAVAKEMSPFVIYAAIPLIITLLICFSQCSVQQW